MHFKFSNPEAQIIANRIEFKLKPILDSRDDQLAMQRLLVNGFNVALDLINSTMHDLKALKNIVGATNSTYLEISNIIVGNCAGLLRFKAMEGMMSNSGAIHTALKTMEVVAQNFDMSGDVKNLFNQTLVQIQNANNKANNTSNSGCYIATIVYGSYYAPQVVELQNFRDNVLQKTTLGRLFIILYYNYSPKIALSMSKQKLFNGVVRYFLNRFISIIKKW